MATTTSTFVELDTGSTLQVTINDATLGIPINLTGSTVQLIYSIEGGSKIIRNMTLVDASNGIVNYTFLANELSNGNMAIEIAVTDSTGKVLTTLDLINLVVRQRLTVGIPPSAPTNAQAANTVYAGPTTGPAAPPVFRTLVAGDFTVSQAGTSTGVDQIGPATGGDETATTLSRSSHAHRIPLASEMKWLTD